MSLSNLPPGTTDQMIEDFQTPFCPKHGNVELEFVSGDYSTGVVAPDGARETRFQQGLYCFKCDAVYDESDV